MAYWIDSNIGGRCNVPDRDSTEMGSVPIPFAVLSMIHSAKSHVMEAVVFALG